MKPVLKASIGIDEDGEDYILLSVRNLKPAYFYYFMIFCEEEIWSDVEIFQAPSTEAEYKFYWYHSAVVVKLYELTAPDETGSMGAMLQCEVEVDVDRSGQ